jgi:glycosyltransferase involved in cell wall biosynthesis
MPTDYPPITVVVIGRNEGERLARCLESIRAADYPSDKLELIYVDTDSTDNSCTVAENLGAKVIRIQPDRPSAAAARNAGWRAARHDLVQFFDGDTILDPAWLKKAAVAIADPQVACVFGRREEIAPHATVYNFWAHHDWYVAPGPADSCAGDALFRRGALDGAGGFDESLIAGEEPDLCYRIRSQQGKTILSLGEPMTRHDMNMHRFTQYWRRCTRTGHAYAEVGGRHRGMHRWRTARRRNLGHLLALLTAIGLSLGFGSPWPLGLWAALCTLLWFRNAVRLRPRMASFGDAMLYSLHHYVAKLPIALGQCRYWVQSILHRRPQPLIEYRG